MSTPKENDNVIAKAMVAKYGESTYDPIQDSPAITLVQKCTDRLRKCELKYLIERDVNARDTDKTKQQLLEDIAMLNVAAVTLANYHGFSSSEIARAIPEVRVMMEMI